MTSTHTGRFLEAIGVRPLPACTSPFDPGYDPGTLASHLEQSAHLMSTLKLSMACWIVAHERSTRAKLGAARGRGVRTVAGGGPFEVAVAQEQLEAYLDLCASLGFDRIECGAGFTEMRLPPRRVVPLAAAYGLGVQFEVGGKHAGAFAGDIVTGLLRQADDWLAAGAAEIVVEAREAGRDVGVFGPGGRLDDASAERFTDAFGLERVSFEAPTKPAQFALIDRFGPSVRLSNVRLEEVLRVETYRRGLHSDAFGDVRLRPRHQATAAR